MTDNKQLSYEEFRTLSNIGYAEDFIHIHQEKMDITGGVVSISEIDKLDDFSDISKVRISGLKQRTFEYFISKYGERLCYIDFWKNKFIEDFSCLGNYPNFKYISFFHNQRATNLWDMSKNTNLTGLVLNDFTRLKKLDGIETAPSLKYLVFGDAIWNKNTLSDIEVLKKSKIEAFSFGAKEIENIDILDFAKIKNLKIVNFRTNLFTTEEVAKLVAIAPHLEGYCLRPWIKFDNTQLKKDVIIVGKGKKWMDSVKDKEKIEKYEKEFYELVKKYQK